MMMTSYKLFVVDFSLCNIVSMQIITHKHDIIGDPRRECNRVNVEMQNNVKKHVFATKRNNKHM